MTLAQMLWECFRHFAYQDHANAAIHCAPVRYSPITFRLAEHLDDAVNDLKTPSELELPHHFDALHDLLADVLEHKGAYEEDKGR